MMSRLLLILAMVTAGAAPAWPGSADVAAVKVVATAPGLYRFDATVRHADTGWDHYADKWEVVAPDGQVLGVRTLLHPHVHEQPFTRSLNRVRIPPALREVTVRAHDNFDGYRAGSRTIRIPA